MSFRRLMNSLDELYDHDGTYPLNYRNSIFRYCHRTAILNKLRKRSFLQDTMSFYFRERIASIYDLGRGFIIIQKEDLKLLEELQTSDLLSKEQKHVLDTLRQEVSHNIQEMESLINELAESFPRAYRHALTQKSIRMLLSNERRQIRQLISNGILSEKDAETLFESVDERADKLNRFQNTTIGTVLRHLLKTSKEKQ